MQPTPNVIMKKAPSHVPVTRDLMATERTLVWVSKVIDHTNITKRTIFP